MKGGGRKKCYLTSICTNASLPSLMPVSLKDQQEHKRGRTEKNVLSLDHFKPANVLWLLMSYPLFSWLKEEYLMSQLVSPWYYMVSISPRLLFLISNQPPLQSDVKHHHSRKRSSKWLTTGHVKNKYFVWYCHPLFIHYLCLGGGVTRCPLVLYIFLCLSRHIY